MVGISFSRSAISLTSRENPHSDEERLKENEKSLSSWKEYDVTKSHKHHDNLAETQLKKQLL